MTKLHLGIACSVFAFTCACADPPSASQPFPPVASVPEETQNPTTPTPPPSKPEPPPPPDPKPTGIVSVYQTTLDGSTYRSGVSAMFGTKVGPPEESCTTKQDGPCAVTICPTLTNDKKTPPSAGRVWFDLPGRVLELTQLADGSYPDAPYEERLFTTNDKLTASADGKEFPAFSLEVVAPPDLTLISPVLESILEKETIDRKKPYTVTWQPKPSGEDPVIVTVTIITTKEQSSATLHVCEGKLEDGKLTIPESAVAAIGATSGEKSAGMLVVGTSRRSSAKVGSDVIRFEVSVANHTALFETIN